MSAGSSLLLGVILLYFCFLLHSLHQLSSPLPCKNLLTSSSTTSSENQDPRRREKLLRRQQKLCFESFWSEGLRVDISLHLGEATKRGKCSSDNQKWRSSPSVWTLKNTSISEASTSNVSFVLPTSVQENEVSLCGYFVIEPSLYGISSNMNANSAVVFPVSLAYFKAQDRIPSKTRSLLNAEAGLASSDRKLDSSTALHSPYVVHPLVLRYIELYSIMDANSLHPALSAPFQVRDRAMVSTRVGGVTTDRVYSPLLWLDDLSIPSKHHLPLSSSNISFKFQFLPTSTLHYGIKRVVQANMNTIKQLGGEDILDEMRYWLSEDQLFYLLVTQVVGWLHILLEYLAFRDDYAFFKGRKSFRGISASSLMFQFFRSTVLFLYLLDRGSSWVILMTTLKGIVYDGWKLYRILQPSVFLAWRGFALPITVTFKPVITGEGTKETNEDVAKVDETAVYDMIAVQHGWYCLFPVIIGMSIYYLCHYQYTSWYSWLISSLVDFTYVFGFLSLTPQIYINYRLQSVAHLPMKSFLYKIFNTFVDDIFAFVVKMPLKHKVMTLRDDAIFIVFLYQWFIYRTDEHRPNEYGFQYKEE